MVHRHFHQKGEPLDFQEELSDQVETTSYNDIAISMDGKGRAIDNVFIERLWWTVKYEDVYPKAHTDGIELYHGLTRYFHYYNEERRHSSLDKQTPAAVYGSTFDVH
jgi:putative transposase